MIQTLAICAAIAIAACGQAAPVSINDLEVEYRPSTVINEFVIDCLGRTGPDEVDPSTIAAWCDEDAPEGVQFPPLGTGYLPAFLRPGSELGGPFEVEAAGDDALKVTLTTREETVYRFTLQNDSAETCQVQVVLAEVDGDGYDVGRADSENMVLPASSRREMSFSVSGDRPELVPPNRSG